MPAERQINTESPAVQTHLSITQAVIQRMASNSASCKAWCITLVSAILVIVADKGKSNFALLALIPTALFLILDGYYLALERDFRESYNSFVWKLHKGKLQLQDVYYITPKGSICSLFGKLVSALLSFSVWPFYGTLALMILLAKWLIIG